MRLIQLAVNSSGQNYVVARLSGRIEDGISVLLLALFPIGRFTYFAVDASRHSIIKIQAALRQSTIRATITPIHSRLAYNRNLRTEHASEEIPINDT